MCMKTGMGCLPALFLKITKTGHGRTGSVHSAKTDSDGRHTSSPSESTLNSPSTKEPLPVYRGGSCLGCGSFTGSMLASPISTYQPPSYESEESDWQGTFSEAVLNTVDETIDGLSTDLRTLSLDIWEHPELGYEEHHAHDILTDFMARHGFTVTRHYLGLSTAWRAEFAHGTGGRVIGLQSEMDALPKIGHACGHNLIAISGVAVAIGLQAALQKHDIQGRIVLLGTPAEEHGGGKIKLLELGGYKEMDVCLMCHPSPGARGATVVQPWTAVQNIEVEYRGHSAHAAYAPWEAQNALDAAFLAYSGISVLRQQMKPSYLVHGVVSGRDWEPNVIPDQSMMRWAVRAPTWAELEVLRGKVVACLEAAAHATGCKADITIGVGYKDCRENGALADEYARIAATRYGLESVISPDILQASTDLGDVSYVLPTIEPIYSIPTEKNGSNHTPQFALSAKTEDAHHATLVVSKALAATALRVLQDDTFFSKIRDSFQTQSQI